jgi:acetylornithine deacetylase/succinyl-diaminopimelate desuccinylase-like protein
MAAHAAEPDWAALDKDAVDLLQRYVRVESINPPADTSAAAALLKSALEAHGFSGVRIYPSGPNGQANLLVRLPGRDRSKKPLLLMNHLDVVPVDAAAWPVPPFSALIKDGVLWGRGAVDMKATGIQHLMALVALKQAGITPSRDIVMLCTADEESNGSKGITWMIENHWSELDPEYVFDEGGYGFSDLLSTSRTTFGVAVGEKQVLWLRLRAKGIAAHGSQPIAENANNILLRAIERAQDQPPSARPNPVVAEMLHNMGGAMADNKFTRAIQKNTMSLTTLRSGVGSPPRPNVIPSVAEATIDCRLLPGVNSDEFISEVKARINDARVTVEIVSRSEDAGTSPSATPLFAVIRKALLAHNPGATVTPMLIPYGTDSVKLRKRGVIAYGFSPMVLSSELVATMHSDAERVPVAEFTRGIRVFYDILRAEF